MTDTRFRLNDFIQEARDRMQGHNNDGGEGAAKAVLAEHPNWSRLNLDVALHGEIEESIFNGLVSSSQITWLEIPPHVQVASVEVILHKAISALPKLEQVQLAISLTETQAERILAILQTSPTLDQIGLFMTYCGDGIAKPFAKCLRESSSLRILAMSWRKLDENEHFAAPMSRTSLHTIFEGISDCKSLKSLGVHAPPPFAGHADALAESLAWAISKSASLQLLVLTLSSLEDMAVSKTAFTTIFSGIGQSRSMKHVAFFLPPVTGDVDAVAQSFASAICRCESLEKVDVPLGHRAFLDKIGSALLHTEAVKNFDLCFRSLEGKLLMLNRNAPWKPLLPMNVPLLLHGSEVLKS